MAIKIKSKHAKVGKAKIKIKSVKRKKRLPKGLKRLTSGVIVPTHLPVKPRKMICVYGKSVNPKLITQSAIDAYNKRRYTTHDFQIPDFISDPRLHNLMVKIAVLDRIEEEVVRIYPDAKVDRINSVTLLIK